MAVDRGKVDATAPASARTVAKAKGAKPAAATAKLTLAKTSTGKVETAATDKAAKPKPDEKMAAAKDKTKGKDASKLALADKDGSKKSAAKADSKKEAAAKEASAKDAKDKDAKAKDPKAKDAKGKAATASAARKAPERHWVQVAGGANKSTLPKAWAGLKAKYPKELAGKSPWTTPLRFTNRLLVGPFKSAGEAQAFVNSTAKSGWTTFTFTSPAGQEVEKLAL